MAETRMITEAHMELLAEKVVHKTLLGIGVDVSNPEGIINFQQDIHFLRSSRLQAKSVQNKTLNGGITVVMSAIGAAALLGIVAFVQGFRL